MGIFVFSLGIFMFYLGLLVFYLGLLMFSLGLLVIFFGLFVFSAMSSLVLFGSSSSSWASHGRLPHIVSFWLECLRPRLTSLHIR